MKKGWVKKKQIEICLKIDFCLFKLKNWNKVGKKKIGVVFCLTKICYTASQNVSRIRSSSREERSQRHPHFWSKKCYLRTYRQIPSNFPLRYLDWCLDSLHLFVCFTCLALVSCPFFLFFFCYTLVCMFFF